MKLLALVNTVLILMAIVFVVRRRLRRIADQHGVAGTPAVQRLAQLRRLDTIAFGAVVFAGVCWLNSILLLGEHWFPVVLRNVTIGIAVAAAGVWFLIGWHEAGGAAE